VANDGADPPVSALPMLMALRVRGRATAAVVAAVTGLTVEDAATGLGQAVAGGLVARDAEGFALSAAGRTELRALVEREAIDRAALATLYEAFLAIDRRLKERITAWQGTVPHVHTGGADIAASATASAAFADVRAVATETRAIVDRLAALVPRHASYARRLSRAVAALIDGDVRFVASPHVDSLHQVWFELHEDLLVTLGRERAA
jgi:hypothetical protein